MFQIIKKSSSSIKQSQLLFKKAQFPFSERIRNFFEVAPIYPGKFQTKKCIIWSENQLFSYQNQSVQIDFQDSDAALFRDKKKVAFNTNQNKLERIKKDHMKNMYGKAKQYVRKQIEKEQKITDVRDNKKKKEITLRERAKTIAKSILVDQESQLFFGFGFDEFIQNLKEKKSKDQEGEYLQKLQKILHQLNIKNDTELIQLYQYVISEATKDTYRNDARALILKKVMVEVQKMKKENNIDQDKLSQYLDYSKSSKEFVMNSLEKDEVKISEDLLKQDLVDQVSQQLALDQLKTKIQINKEQEAPQSQFQNKIFSSDFSEDSDFFEIEQDKNQLQQKMGMSKAGVQENFEDFKADQIYQQIKSNFKRNKVQYQQEIEEQQRYEQESQKFFQFLEKSESDQQIEQYLRKYQLTDEVQTKPDFLEILKNIDYLIDNAPISLKSNLKTDSTEFSGSFLKQNLSEQDMLWNNFETNFINIFPTGKLPTNSNDNEISENQVNEINPTDEIATIYEYDGEIQEDESIRNHEYTEKDLKEKERIELEVYRRIKTDPFFTHYIQNDLRYFSERMMDGFADVNRAIKMHDKSGDIMNYNEPDFSQQSTIEQWEEDEPDVKFNEKSRIEQSLKEKIFAGGKRKKSHCIAILTKGSGKVSINRKKYLDYFPQPFHRNVCLKAIYMANLACQYDVDIHVRGGGVSGQSQAISVAVTRAVVKLNPAMRKFFLSNEMLKTDPRKRERKKTGRYRARKGWTYVRR